MVGSGDNVIDRLINIFSHCDLPEQLVSDNGLQCVSFEFKQFMTDNGIRPILTALRLPRSNGQTARFLATFTQALTDHSQVPSN